jgi:hypothetical protein
MWGLGEKGVECKDDSAGEVCGGVVKGGGILPCQTNTIRGDAIGRTTDAGKKNRTRVGSNNLSPR